MVDKSQCREPKPLTGVSQSAIMKLNGKVNNRMPTDAEILGVWKLPTVGPIGMYGKQCTKEPAAMLKVGDRLKCSRGQVPLPIEAAGIRGLAYQGGRAVLTETDIPQALRQHRPGCFGVCSMMPPELKDSGYLCRPMLVGTKWLGAYQEVKTAGRRMVLHDQSWLVCQYKGVIRSDSLTREYDSGEASADDKGGVGDYLFSSLKGAVLGDFAGETTVLGAVGSAVIGCIPIVGQIADVRDLIYAVSHTKGKSFGENAFAIGLAVVAFIPLVGELKNVKHLKNLGIVKAAAKLTDKAGAVFDAVGNKMDDVIGAAAKKAGGLFKGLADKADNLFSGLKRKADEVFSGKKGSATITKGTDEVPNVTTKPKPYANSRPSYSKGQIEEVWKNAKDPVTGKVIDPTGKEITWDATKPRNGQWDMGHIPGQKYSDVHKQYMDDAITKEEFIDWYQDPANYRPELPSTNRGHGHE